MPKSKRGTAECGGTSKENLRWSDEMDSCLIDSMLEQRVKGNFIDGQLSSTGYNEVVNILRDAFGLSIRKEHIKNRLKTLKDHFGKCFDLFNAWSGISWDPITQMFDAEPHVWKEICEAKPEASKWMRTKVKHYDKLYDLYAADRASGKHAENASDMLNRWEKEGINLNDSLEGIEMFEPNLHLGSDTHLASNMDGFSPSFGNSNHSQGNSSSKGSKRKAPMAELQSEVEKMTMGIKDLTDVLKEGNYYFDRSIAVAERQATVAERQTTVAEKQAEIAQRGLTILQQSRPRVYSEQDVWAELEAFDMTPDTRIRCYRFLCRDEKAKREFFGVPQTMLYEILYQLMLESGPH